jgi:hypothetical protein
MRAPTHTPLTDIPNQSVPNYFGTFLLQRGTFEIPDFVFGDEMNNLIRREGLRVMNTYIPTVSANRFIFRALPHIKQIYDFSKNHPKASKSDHRKMMQIVKEKFQEQVVQHQEVIYEFILALQNDDSFMKLSVSDKLYSISFVLFAMLGHLE